MAITSGYFNSVNGDRKYNADQMSEYFEGIINEGVCQHIDGGLAVTAGTGLSVNVAAGKAFIGKKWIRNDASLTLTISSASTSYARIDAVVLRRNNTTRTCQIVVKSGTPAASPAAPTMTRNSTTYEMALAYVNVAANATSVTVTDKRADSTVCGWATVAQETSGEVDQMLNDMKTGFDGVVYSSPAAMVQGEDTKLHTLVQTASSTDNLIITNDFKNQKVLYPFIVKGYVTYSTGVISDSSDDAVYRTDYVEIPENCKSITHNFSFIYSTGYAFYNSSKTYISGGNSSGTINVKPNAKYVVFTDYSDTSNHSGRYLQFNFAESLMDRFDIVSNNINNYYNATSTNSVKVVCPLHVGSYINKTNGEYAVGSDDNFEATKDYIPIPYQASVMIPNNFTFYSAGGYAFYDRTKTFISGGSSTGSVVIPDKAKFVRLTDYDANGDHSDEYSITFLCDSEELIKTCIVKPISLDGKSCAVFGDSIAFGWNGTERTSHAWIYQFLSDAGMTRNDFTRAGSAFTEMHNEVRDIRDMIKSNLTDDYDIAIIAGGTNDYGFGYTRAQFEAAIIDITTWLKNNYNGIVIFITPINRTEYYIDERMSLNAYRNIIAEYALLNGFSVIDGSEIAIPNVDTSYARQVLYDGVHPTDAGYDIYTNYLKSILL